jgi:IMP dehydrogenase
MKKKNPFARLDRFFSIIEKTGLALTYGDVRLRTGYSETDPKDADISTHFSRNVPLKCPLVSAAMDTVTEAPMAIAMAMFGGLGIIHKALTAEEQASQVRRVKLHLNCLIEHPICVREDETIGEILARRQEKGHDFHSFPVLSTTGKIVGLLTRNDFDVCNSPKATAAQAMTPFEELVVAREETSVENAYEILRSNHKKILPLMNESRELTGMFVFSDLKRIMSGMLSQYNVDADGHLRVGAAIDVGPSELLRAEMLLQAGCDVIVVDKAHGDMRPVKDMLQDLKALKRKYPGRDVVAGNISEPESAVHLAKWGVDGIKIGQGPGSICTTRDVAGVGCPQVTAGFNCAKAVRGMGIPICLDGGITKSGDIPIALGIGASSVMMGLMLAGTDESPGEIKETKKGRVKVYRGMGSLPAMKESWAARARYRQGDTPKDKLVSEGVESVVPYKGAVIKILEKMAGGLRAGLGYVGASSILELQEKADLHWLSAAGQAESHPHDVSVTDETQ